MATPHARPPLGEPPCGAPPLAGSPPSRAPLTLVPGQPPPLLRRIEVHNAVVHRVRRFLQREGYVEIPVPELTPATGSCEVVDSMFSLDYFGDLAFPRQTGQLFLEELVSRGMDAVYCEGESLRKEHKVDGRHLTEFKLIEIERRDLTLPGLCDLQERLLKDVLGSLHADLIGGRNVTRLDRILAVEHPRLTYREAIAALSRRGLPLAFGDDLDARAEAALVRYCGNLPIHVTHYPESLKFFNMKLWREDPELVECVDYVLPLAGETFGGSLREPDCDILLRRLRGGTMYGHLMQRAREFARHRAAAEAAAGAAGATGAVGEELAARYQRRIEDSFLAYLEPFRGRWIERAGFGLGVARLLQFVLGLESVKDAVAFPMDRTCFAGVRRLAAAC